MKTFNVTGVNFDPLLRTDPGSFFKVENWPCRHFNSNFPLLLIKS